MGVITCGWPSSFLDKSIYRIIFLLVSFGFTGKRFLKYPEGKPDRTNEPVPGKYLSQNPLWRLTFILLFGYTKFINLPARVIVNSIKRMRVWVVLAITVRLLFL